MKTIPIKSSIAALTTAATLLTSGIVPTVQANAGGLKVLPLGPNPCISKPWMCGPGGIKLPPPGPGPLPPAPPPAPPAPSGGLSKDQLLGLGIVGGVLAGAAIANAVRPKDVIVQSSSNGNAHVNWCFGRYKSYRMSDNSFQPYNGPRKQCYSPYL
jgi:BA14K-like protein